MKDIKRNELKNEKGATSQELRNEKDTRDACIVLAIWGIITYVFLLGWLVTDGAFFSVGLFLGLLGAPIMALLILCDDVVIKRRKK